jgi:hypothetical protein
MAFIKHGTPENLNLLKFCPLCLKPTLECICENKSENKDSQNKTGDKDVRKDSCLGSKRNNRH